MSWKHVILTPCFLSFALMAALTVTPEDVQQKVAAKAQEIGLARWEFTFTKSQSWFDALQQAESTKANLTSQLTDYSDTLLNILSDYFINVTSVDDATFECIQSVMNDFSNYTDAILDNIDDVVLEVKVMLTSIATIYDEAVSEVNELSDTINSCKDTDCAEELDKALSQLDSNVTYILTSKEIKLQELWYEISNTNISDAYTANLDQLLDRAAECVNLPSTAKKAKLFK